MGRGIESSDDVIFEDFEGEGGAAGSEVAGEPDFVITPDAEARFELVAEIGSEAGAGEEAAHFGEGRRGGAAFLATRRFEGIIMAACGTDAHGKTADEIFS